MNSYQIKRNGKIFIIQGKFGCYSVYHDKYCVVFGIMTKNDAENWIWKNY